MNPAAATRLEKEKHPERFCPDKRCLRRIRFYRGAGIYRYETRPCPKHMKATTAPPALTDETAGNRADRNYSGSDTSKITEGTEEQNKW